MVERVIFNFLAFPLFVIIFSKMITKNDTTYMYVVIGQALGIAINFAELIANTYFGPILKTLTYIASVIIPSIIIFVEYKNIVIFSEIFHIGFANVYLFLKNNKKAKSMLISLVSKYPNSYLGHKILAEVYEKEGGLRKSIDEYVKVIDINKKDYKSYFKIAELLHNLGKKEEAAQMLQNLLKKKPEYYEASMLLGDILCEQEQFKEALNVYTNALKYNPNDYEIYYNLGLVYTNLNDFQNAKICYDKAANLNGLLYKAYYNLGQISLIFNDLDEAERYFNESIKGEEVEAMSYYQLARIYMLRGENDKAINFVNLAIELDIGIKELFEKDPIFIPIKVYMTINDSKIVVESKKTLTLKEEKTQDHLEKTYYLVGKLGYNLKRNVKEPTIEKPDIHRERDL